MSGVSSLSASNSSSLLAYLQDASKSSGASGAGCAGKSQDSPTSRLSSELQQQGVSGTDLDALLKKIQTAVASVKSGSDGKPDRGAIRDAVNQVLKDAGIDTDKIAGDLKAKGPRPHHRHAGGGTNSSTETDTDPLLQSLGVDPTDFNSALGTAVQNAGGDGTIDLSKLFASAAVGSQLDMQV